MFLTKQSTVYENVLENYTGIQTYELITDEIRLKRFVLYIYFMNKQTKRKV